MAAWVLGKRGIAKWACVLLMLATVVPAARASEVANPLSTAQGTTGTSAPPKAPVVQHRGDRLKAPHNAANTDARTLRDALQAQQQQIQILRDEMARRDAALQRLHTEVSTIKATTQTAPQLSQLAAANQHQAAEIADLQRRVAELQALLKQMTGELEGQGP